jgi:hypothetical protein
MIYMQDANSSMIVAGGGANNGGPNEAGIFDRRCHEAVGCLAS